MSNTLENIGSKVFLPLTLILLVTALMIAGVYQLFFRYYFWIGGPNNTYVYERDSLTGGVRMIRPGDQVPYWHRLVGQPTQPSTAGRKTTMAPPAEESDHPDTPLSENANEQTEHSSEHSEASAEKH